MNKPMIVSDEYREGYAAFNHDNNINPYDSELDFVKWACWEDGLEQAEEDWRELIGEKSVRSW